MKKFASSVKTALELAVQQYGTQRALAEAAGVNEPNISRWLKNRDPRVGEISPILDLIGAKLVLPNEIPRVSSFEDSTMAAEFLKLKEENIKLERDKVKLEGAIEMLEKQLEKAIDRLSISTTLNEGGIDTKKGAI